jgi:MFS family permease
VIQPVVALASDRFDTRWLGTLGFLAAVVAIGLVGYADSFSQLLVLQIVGAAGIGAFHPVAAAAVGHLAGPRRSMGIAWFYLAGMLGGILGNVSAGHYVERFARIGGSTDAGLKALLYLTPVGIAFVIALGLAIHGMPHRTHDAHTIHRALPERERRKRWTGVWLLYAGNVLRFGVDVCLIQLIIRWTEVMAMDRSVGGALTDAVRIDASQLNGPLQAAKQIGMGLGGVALGWWFHVRHERALLVAMPLLGAATVALLPYTAGWTALLVCAIAGVGYGAVVPMTISMAQRLIPHRTSLASGLMMGGAWAVASVGSPISQSLAERYGLERAFLVVAVSLLLASVLGLFIPRAAERGL